MKLATELSKRATGRTVYILDEPANGLDPEGIRWTRDLLKSLASGGRSVLVSGLDQDFLGRPFNAMPTLLALADEVTKLTAICTVCGAEATR